MSSQSNRESPSWRRYLRFWRTDVAGDVRDEIAFHIEGLVQQQVAAGVPEADARRIATERFGNADRIEHEMRTLASRRETAMRRTDYVQNLLRDLRFAARQLAKRPAFTGVAIVTLALGIGANTAIFSIFDEMLLRPLPVSHPERLVNLAASGPTLGFQSCNRAGGCDVVFSYPMFKELERAKTAFSGIAAHVFAPANIAYRQQSMNGTAMLVSGSYFPLLGLAPAMGRLIGADDDRQPGGSPVAVLGFGYWRTQLGGDSSVLGTGITIKGKRLTIVGVAPKGFEGTTLGTVPQVYLPITMAATVGATSPDTYEERREAWLYLFARLAPAVTIDQAARAVNAVYRPILAARDAPLYSDVGAETMAKFKTKTITLEDGRRGQSVMHAQTRAPLVLLFATTGIVLLIACANIANLLLARGASRALEMGVRLSLGATRRQLLLQLLTESCLLATVGGGVSLLIAQWTLSLFTRRMPAESATALLFQLSGPALWFAAGLSVATGVAFGVFPALHNTRADLMTTIREGTGKHSGSRTASRFWNGLVTAQIALSMALLIPAGLFVKSLRNVSQVELGFKTSNVVTFALSPETSGYEPARSRRLLDEVERALAVLPGVTAATAADVPLLAGRNRGKPAVSVQGFAPGPDANASSRFNKVGVGYFKALGIPILSGREFTAADVAGASRVAVVNETFARKFGLGRDAVGKFIGIGANAEPNILIVGLAKDAKYSEVKQATPPVYFIPYRQDTTMGSLQFYVRASGDPTTLFSSLRAMVARLDPRLAIQDLKTLPQQVSDNVYLDRMIGVLSVGFAGLAILLAAIGLYGVLAYSFAQRTREIGVRMALGANPGAVLAMVLRQVALMTLVGGVVGIAGALALGRGARSLLFEVKGYDPLVMAASVAALSLVALAAAMIPALRASRVDPVNALRSE